MIYSCKKNKLTLIHINNYNALFQNIPQQNQCEIIILIRLQLHSYSGQCSQYHLFTSYATILENIEQSRAPFSCICADEDVLAKLANKLDQSISNFMYNSNLVHHTIDDAQRSYKYLWVKFCNWKKYTYCKLGHMHCPRQIPMP